MPINTVSIHILLGPVGVVTFSSGIRERLTQVGWWTPDMADPALVARDLTVEKGDRQILDGITLAIDPGERFLIQGKSGAGKSTLFEVLGLLDEPTDGEVRIDGTPTVGLPESRKARLRAQALGFVFQDFQLIPDLTAIENARLPQEHVDSADDDWIDTLFETLELTDVTDQYPATLSGGEKQRVAIARALANRPGVVLADEPTGQLDPETTDRVLALLTRVQEQAGSALVVVSHDPQVARHFDTVHTLAAGALTPGAMAASD